MWELREGTMYVSNTVGQTSVLNIKNRKGHLHLLCTRVLCALHAYTVELPNRGHFGTAAFVLSLEVVLFSEVV